ncbi:radical SAM/SPASM domain-containing protein [Thermus scotoductus]|uniref:Radical SAM/SPASM domain-containing protein n=1 Tax=Thermus scotoductus TaxID=37636 RepID=A0A430S4U4_THESC|nr:radical SAM/SPASM domain-containing protein [Thermus scotoductus]RTH06066.1 radical SAM/SPASM domain-containing protein [Thermus scotoductus]RTH08044.1 radical SAM/SPASM domain-containing protein [Thermus scotoductus]RTH10227.1 radical SAM/SPASM domain-containing protein [Thermus scotoductus]RTH14629.1 radical SAM/SPASM domain-containing protein [Thermus scotoductus]
METTDFARYPYLVAWEVTHACLLACRHCRASAEPHPLPGELTTEEGLRLVEEVATYHPKPLLLLTGGDPLARKDLFQILEKAKALGLKVGLTPASTPLLTREMVFRLKAAGVTRLALSLDGATSESHDAFRGAEGTFQRTLEALSWAREAGLPTQVNTTVTRDNWPEIQALPDLLAEKGVVLWSLFFLVPVGRGGLLRQLSTKQFEEVLHWLYQISKTYPFHVKTTEAHHFRRVVLQRRQEEGVEDRALAAGESLYREYFQDGMEHSRLGVTDGNGFVFVSATGDVAPSGFLPLYAGNIREQPLLEIYRNSPLFQELRNKDLLKGKCGVCEYRYVCGGSRARAWAETGDYLASEPRCAYVPPAWLEKVGKHVIGR